jgi:hypothetical protein
MTWRFMTVLSIFAGGCTLYFDGPPPPDAPGNEPLPPPDASATCPKPGTYAEILYPLDGATNVQQPVPIEMHVVIPNTLDGKGIHLSDANGVQVDLEHYDASCSIPIPPFQTGPVQDVTWVQCYDGLEPNAEYTWHIWITCYDDTGAHEIATSTFRTAP